MPDLPERSAVVRQSLFHRRFLDLEPAAILSFRLRELTYRIPAILDPALLPDPVVRTGMITFGFPVLRVPDLLECPICFPLILTFLDDPPKDIGVFLVIAGITTLLIPPDIHDNAFLQAIRTRHFPFLVHPVTRTALYPHESGIPGEV